MPDAAAELEPGRESFLLAEADAREALIALRRASDLWRRLGPPYEAARTRVLVGEACEALGDVDAMALET